MHTTTAEVLRAAPAIPARSGEPAPRPPEVATPGLPLGVGAFSPRWWAAAAALLVVVALGLFAWSRQIAQGLGVTGLGTLGRGGAPWGLYITFDVYFVGVSFSGITVAALIRLFAIEKLRPISRMAELMTIIALLLGALCVMADLGRPLAGLTFLPLYARPMSPFFGTFSLVVGAYLFASVVYFYLAGRADAALCANGGRGRLRRFHALWAAGFRNTPAEHARHRRASFWLAVLILPLLVTAHSTLGFIFGVQGGRPGWFSALQGPGFVVLAGASGIGLLVVVAAGVRRALALHSTIGPDAFRWLGNALMVLTAVYLYFMVAEILTMLYAAPAAETHMERVLTSGVYAGPFWSVSAALGAGFLVLFVQFVSGRTSIAWTVAAGLLVNAGAVLKRYLIVLPSQTHGLMLPYETGAYVPSWVELAVVAGLLALGTLLFLLFLKVFPIVPLEDSAPAPRPADAPAASPRRGLRRVLVGATLAAGLAMAAVGFLLAARVGTEPWREPLLPGSPVLFIAGVMLCFGAAVVYEVLPDRRRPASAP